MVAGSDKVETVNSLLVGAGNKKIAKVDEIQFEEKSC